MLKDYTCTRCCRKKYDCLTPFIQCEDVIEPIINPKKPSYPLSPSYCNVVFVKKKTPHISYTLLRLTIPAFRLLCLLHLCLIRLGHRINNPTHASNQDSAHVPEIHGVPKEQDAARRDGQLVQSTDEGVCRRATDTDTPCGGVGDEDGGGAGKGDSGKKKGSTFFGAVKISVCQFERRWKIMEKKTYKLREKEAAPQSSMMREKTNKTGIESKLL